jgi:hypothetical protein
MKEKNPIMTLESVKKGAINDFGPLSPPPPQILSNSALIIPLLSTNSTNDHIYISTASITPKRTKIHQVLSPSPH